MIVLNSDADIPLYIQIYEQLKEEIITGILPKGTRLPSTRSLAETLAVGRNTVENAYLQLSSEGYVDSKIGSGFVVQDIQGMIYFGKSEIQYKGYVESISEKNIEKNNDKKNKINNELSKEINNEHKIFPYNFEYGHLSSEDFPLNIWKKVSNKALASLTAEDMTIYSDRLGELELRNDLKDYLRSSRGVSCSAEQIILCSGFEYALSLLSQLLRETYNQIAMEDPGYIGARNIFKNNGFKIVPIEVEKDGLNIKALNNSTAQVIYVTPSHQFPTGVVMPIQKRMLLLNWAAAKEGIIIEDDYDSELRYNSRPIPSISSIAGSENVIYIGTLSKALSPSLRVCYMVLPHKWMLRYNENFIRYQSPVSLIQQRIIREFIHSRHWESHLRKTCIVNKKKHDLLVRTIIEFMDDCVIIHGRNAGLHIILESKQDLTESEMIERAKAYGVLVYPVSTFWMQINRYADNMVLLGFGNVSETMIVDGIKQLALAWKIQEVR